MRKMKSGLLIAVLTVALGGCEGEDERAVRLAMEGADRQAQQNAEMAQLQREVASGTRRLIEADSQARQELIGAQKELARQQADLARQHDALENERRQWAVLRYRFPER